MNARWLATHLNKLVTWFFAASGAAFVALGVLAILGGQYLVGGVIAVLGGADLFMAIRRRKPPAPEPLRRTPPRESPLPPPVPLPDARTLASVPEPVTACPACGFLGIRSGSGQSVYIEGGPVLSGCICPRCGYRGLPLSVDTRVDYVGFVQQLHHASEAPRGPHP